MCQDKPELLVDFCDYRAAKFAVANWHYSKRMPIGKMIKLGVWENTRFIGVVIFARGNTPTLGKAYGLEMIEICELVRVAIHDHTCFVTKIISVAIKKLKLNEGLRLIVSFADPSRSHLGIIYQAGNWIYTGKSQPSWQWFHDGRWKHNREITSGAFGRKSKVKNYSMLPKRLPPGKHRYLYPLDKRMRRQILPLAKPYPKHADVV